MKAIKQIQLLLEHVNRCSQPPNTGKLRRDLDRFIKSFDGREASGFLKAIPDTRGRPFDKPRHDDPVTLLRELRLVLLKCFGDDALDDVGFTLGSLTLNVRSAAPDVIVQQQVSGAPRDLAIFLLMHLLMRPELVRLHRCKREYCDQLFVTEPVKGRPPVFCSVACRDVSRAMGKLHQKVRRR